MKKIKFIELKEDFRLEISPLLLSNWDEFIWRIEQISKTLWCYKYNNIAYYFIDDLQVLKCQIPDKLLKKWKK